MEKFLLSTPMDIDKFMALGHRANDVAVANLKKDEDYDDAPDEFIGALDFKSCCPLPLQDSISRPYLGRQR
jgi:hypothetical protein